MIKKKKRHILNIQMEGENMHNKELQPEVIVFAGPNGSGKSTITRMSKTVFLYVVYMY